MSTSPPRTPDDVPARHEVAPGTRVLGPDQTNADQTGATAKGTQALVVGENGSLSPAGSLLGLVYRRLHDHHRLVTALLDHPLVAVVDFSVTAPLFKGNPAIVAALARAQGLKEKIDAYFAYGLLDEDERLRMARMFAARFARSHPRSVRRDLFVASGNVLVFSCVLRPPPLDRRADEVLSALQSAPVDASLLCAVQAGHAVAPAHLTFSLRVFIDHVLNPLRHKDPAVVVAADELDAHPPCVIEVEVSPGLPGYVQWVLAPVARQMDARLVWLQT
jgi:hypothetical protein